MSLDATRMQIVRDRGIEKKMIYWILLIRMKTMNCHCCSHCYQNHFLKIKNEMYIKIHSPRLSPSWAPIHFYIK